jgi:hypothetical protein
LEVSLEVSLEVRAVRLASARNPSFDTCFPTPCQVEAGEAATEANQCAERVVRH